MTPHVVRAGVRPSTLVHAWDVVEGAVLWADLRTLRDALDQFPKGDLCITQYLGRPLVCNCATFTIIGLDDVWP